MTLAHTVRAFACATALLCATAAPAYAFQGMEGSVAGKFSAPSRELSTVRTQAVTGPDSFENDDTFAGATTLVPGVESGVHNFYNATPPAESNYTVDVDYAKFTATAGLTYRISTTFQGMPAGAFWSSPMELVVDDGGGWGGYGSLQVYSEYENSMDASNSKVVWTCPTTGTYYVRVSDWYDEYPETEYTVLLEELGAVAPGSVSRIAGSDRYKTAAKLATNSSGTYAGVTKFVIASGLDKSMPDAMTASGLAGALNAPVVLIRPDLKSLPAPTRDAIAAAAALNRGKTIQFHIVGGTASVPVALERQLRAAALGKATIERISGPDRYSTAAAVAAHIRKHVPEYLLTAFVTNGENPAFFSDALTVSPVAARLAAPILLVKSKSVPAATAAALQYYPNRIIVGSYNKAIYANSVGKAVLGSDFSKGVWVIGNNRASTARHFAEFWEAQAWEELPVASHYTTTNSLADALTAGSSPRLAGNYILFVDKMVTPDRTVAYATDQFIQTRRLAPPQLTIVGGTGTVDSGVERRLKDLVGDRFSVPAHESGGIFVDGGFNSGANGLNLSSIWTRQLLGGTTKYSSEHPTPGTPMGAKISGVANEFVWVRETRSSGMTSNTAEYRFWIYSDNTSGYRYVLDNAEENGSFYVEWLQGGLIYVYLDRSGSPAPYSNSGYYQIGTFEPGAMQYRIVTNFTNHTYTVSRRPGIGLEWTFLKASTAPDNNIPMRSRTVSRSNGICFDTFGPGDFWFDEVQYSNTGIIDVPAKN